MAQKPPLIPFAVVLILAGESMFEDKTADALLLVKLQHQVGEDERKRVSDGWRRCGRSARVSWLVKNTDSRGRGAPILPGPLTQPHWHLSSDTDERSHRGARCLPPIATAESRVEKRVLTARLARTSMSTLGQRH